MNSYEIIDDNYQGKGPFRLEQIEVMMARDEISKAQEVKRLGDEKSVSAEHAVIFHQEEVEEDSPAANGSMTKMIIGILCCVMGLGAGGLYFHAISMDKPVSMRKLLIAIMLILAGIKLLQGSLSKNKD